MTSPAVEPAGVSEAPLCLCKTPWLHLCPEHVPCTANPYARVRMLAYAVLNSSQQLAEIRGMLENWSNCVECGARRFDADVDLASSSQPSRGKCETCNGRGEVGGPRGQTPESFEYVTEPCPDCA